MVDRSLPATARFAALVLVAIFAVLPLNAQEVTARLSNSEVSVGDIIEYRLEIVGNASITGAPRASDDTVAYTGASGRSETFGTGARIVRTLWWQFEAIKPGPFTIHGPRVTFDNGTAAVEPVSGTVRARPGIDLSGLGEVGRSSNDTLRRRLGDDLFTVVEVSNPEPYVGEVIEVRTYVYWRGGSGLQPRQAAGQSWPGGNGVTLAEDTRAGRPRQWVRDSDTVRVDDRVFFRHYVMSAPVAAVRSGTSRVNGSRVRLDLGTASAFDFDAPAVTIDVRPLPDVDEPVVARLVGNPTIGVTPDREQLRQGDLLKLDIRISGEGYFETVSLDNLPEVDGLIEVDRETGFNIVRSASPLVSTRTTSIVYQVTAAGRIDFPELRFAVFDPSSGEYRIAKSSMLTFEAEPSAYSSIQVAGERVPNGRTVRRGEARLFDSNGGILDIETRGLSGRVYGRSARPLALNPVYWAAHAVPLGALAVAGLVIGWRRRQETDSAATARREARQRAQAALADAERCLSSNPAGCHTAIARALDAMASAALGQNAAGMTREEIEAALRERGTEEQTLELLGSLRERCDAARYAPTMQSESSMQRDLDDARTLAEALAGAATEGAAK